MQTRNPLLDDLARVTAGGLGVAAGLRREAEELVRQRVAALLGEADLVTREEFEAVRALAVRAREENEALAARIAILETVLAKIDPAPENGAQPDSSAETAAQSSNPSPEPGFQPE